jgi:hypothetical protein
VQEGNQYAFQTRAPISNPHTGEAGEMQLRGFRNDNECGILEVRSGGAYGFENADRQSASPKFEEMRRGFEPQEILDAPYRDMKWIF